jgi:hypothetical protein
MPGTKEEWDRITRINQIKAEKKTMMDNYRDRLSKEMDEYLDSINTSSNSNQVDGTHYVNKGIQPWDYIAANNLDFFQGSVVKYVTRFREKGGIKDLEKAKHFINKLIELETK